MNPKIESFIQQMYEAFPTAMTPEFIETIEKDLENKLLYEQISFLKEEILPSLQEGKSSIMGEKCFFSDKSYDENFEQNNKELILTDIFKPDKSPESETSNHTTQDTKEEPDEDIDMEKTSKEDEKLEYTDQINDKNQEQLLLTGDELFNFLREKLEDISNINDLNNLMPEIKRLKNEETTKDSKALLCRKVGEAYLKHDCRKKALNSFKKALDYNPKVGVKRLYNKLKKELDEN